MRFCFNFLATGYVNICSGLLHRRQRIGVRCRLKWPGWWEPGEYCWACTSLTPTVDAQSAARGGAYSVGVARPRCAPYGSRRRLFRSPTAWRTVLRVPVLDQCRSANARPRSCRQGSTHRPAPGMAGFQTRCQMMTPRAASHGRGSILVVPFCHTSKCRCGPVDWPRLPISAICWPHLTFWPACTEKLFMWP
jgi:hypothetical protein